MLSRLESPISMYKFLKRPCIITPARAKLLILKPIGGPNYKNTIEYIICISLNAYGARGLRPPLAPNRNIKFKPHVRKVYQKKVLN